MSQSKTSRNVKQWGIRAVVGIILLGVLGLSAWTLGALNYNYSSGERVGYVQKVSRRGWLCKTLEGELSMVNLPGQPAQTFAFTVRNQQVYDKINLLAGRKLALEYEQHKGLPTSCTGDTEYFIINVRAVDDHP